MAPGDGAPRVGALATAIAVVFGFFVILLSWTLLHTGLYADGFPLTALFQSYGERTLDGLVPYRDFVIPYPPAALPAFLLPALGPEGNYQDLFEYLMLLSAEAAIGFAAFMLRAVGAGLVRIYAAVVFIGLAPLVLGSVVLGQYDLWPAALTSAALAALVAGRARLASGVLALAIAAKLYAIALVPVAAVYLWRLGNRRIVIGSFAVLLVAGVALTVPFALGSGTLDESAKGQTVNRPLQFESLGGAFLLAAHQLGLYTVTIVQVPGTQGPAGSLPDAIANVSEVLQVLAVLAVAFVFYRGPMTKERLLIASAAAVVGFLAFGKVLAANYMIWLIPLVPLVAGRLGLAASGLLAGALALTQVWYPRRYFEVLFLEDLTWVVLARDLVVVALYVVLLLGLRPGPPRSESRVPPARVEPPSPAET